MRKLKIRKIIRHEWMVILGSLILILTWYVQLKLEDAKDSISYKIASDNRYLSHINGSRDYEIMIGQIFSDSARYHLLYYHRKIVAKKVRYYNEVTQALLNLKQIEFEEDIPDSIFQPIDSALGSVTRFYNESIVCGDNKDTLCAITRYHWIDSMTAEIQDKLRVAQFDQAMKNKVVIKKKLTQIRRFGYAAPFLYAIGIILIYSHSIRKHILDPQNDYIRS